MENISNKPIEVIYYLCDEDLKTRVAYVMPGETAPENKNCRRWRGGLIILTGSGWRIRSGPEAGSPFHFEGPWETPVSKAPAVEENPFFNVKAFASFGLWHAVDIADGCKDCGVSNEPFLVNGGAMLFFGPAALVLGGLRGSEASVSFTGGTTTPGAVRPPQPRGVTVTTSETFFESFNALEVGGRINLLKLLKGKHACFLAVQGGGLEFTRHERDVIVITSGSTSQTLVFRDSSGGFSPYYGGGFEAGLFPHVAGTFDFKRSITTSGPFRRETNMYLFGVMLYIHEQRALFRLLQ